MSHGLLTGKQAWRRQFKSPRRPEQHDILFKECSSGSKIAKNVLPARSSSLPTVTSILEQAFSARQWCTTGDLVDIKANTRTTKKKKCNTVKFNSTLRIVLIPARSDYESSNLTEILWWTENDFKKFREAAFEELEFIMNSEMKLNSTREALDIMYQPHDDLFGESDDDDNFFLYLDDKEASFYSIQSTSYSNSNINMNNNNDNENCQNYNDNYYEVIDSIQSKNNDYNISFCPLKKKNVHNNNSTVCKSADVKDFSHTNSTTNENRNKNKNHSYKTDLFGMKNSVENEIIFDRTRTVQNPTSVSVCTSLNIPGINQIAKSDEKKRDDEKCKGKEKEKDMLPYDTTALTATAHIHPLAYICV